MREPVERLLDDDGAPAGQGRTHAASVMPPERSSDRSPATVTQSLRPSNHRPPPKRPRAGRAGERRGCRRRRSRAPAARPRSSKPHSPTGPIGGGAVSGSATQARRGCPAAAVDRAPGARPSRPRSPRDRSAAPVAAGAGGGQLGGRSARAPLLGRAAVQLVPPQATCRPGIEHADPVGLAGLDPGDVHVDLVPSRCGCFMRPAPSRVVALPAPSAYRPSTRSGAGKVVDAEPQLGRGARLLGDGPVDLALAQAATASNLPTSRYRPSVAGTRR